MKLSDFKGEDALDLLAEIIEPAASILADDELKRIYNRGEKKITLVKYVIKNHKREVMEILAAMDGVPVEEYSCTVLTLPVKVMEILNDKELMELFTSAGQTEGAKSFGSPTENTEANDQ